MFNPVLSLESLYLALCDIFGVLWHLKGFRGRAGLNQFIDYIIIDAFYRSALTTLGIDVSFIQSNGSSKLDMLGK